MNGVPEAIKNSSLYYPGCWPLRLRGLVGNGRVDSKMAGMC